LGIRVLINDPIHPDGVKLLRNAGFELIDTHYTQDELKREIKNFDILIVRSATKVTKDIIEAGSNLKIIARAGVGLDNIDLDAANARGIKVVNAPEAPSISVAELVMGLIFVLFRNIPQADKSIKEGKWLKKEFLGLEIKGKTLGILGFGRIGREVALRAKAFGMNICVYDVVEKSLEAAKEIGAEPYGPNKNDLYTMLSKIDVLTLHVPLVKSTYHLISDEEIARLKDGAFIINTSRGGVLDEEAAYKALISGKLRGLGLDVFEVEPPTSGISAELVKLPNVIATPHIGASTVEAQRRAGVTIAEKIVNILKSAY